MNMSEHDIHCDMCVRAGKPNPLKIEFPFYILVRSLFFFLFLFLFTFSLALLFLGCGAATHGIHRTLTWTKPQHSLVRDGSERANANTKSLAHFLGCEGFLVLARSVCLRSFFFSHSQFHFTANFFLSVPRFVLTIPLSVYTLCGRMVQGTLFLCSGPLENLIFVHLKPFIKNFHLLSFAATFTIHTQHTHTHITQHTIAT